MHVFLANVTDAQRPDIAETVGQVRTYIMQMVARVPSDAAALSDLMPTYGSDGGIVPNSSAAAMQTWHCQIENLMSSWHVQYEYLRMFATDVRLRRVRTFSSGGLIA